MNLMYLYYVIHFIYGISYFIYGPYIPFLAQLSGKSQPDFFPMFLAKGIGFLIGPILKITLFPNYEKLHQGLFISTFIIGITMILLTVSYSIPFLVAVTFLNIFSCSLVDIFVNISIIAEAKVDVGKYINYAHGFHGFGTVLGPFFLGLFGAQSLKFYGIFTILVSLPLLFYESPNVKKAEEQETEKKEDKKQIPEAILNRICGLMFMYSVLIHSFLSWYPTFCLMLGYLTKQQGAFIVSIMALIMIALRFINFNIIKALNIMTSGDIFLFVSVIIAYFMGYKNYIIYFGAFMFSIFNYGQYPYYYSLPTYFNYNISIKNGTKIIMIFAIGQTLLVTLSGYIMDFIHPIALHFYILIFAVLSRWLYLDTLRKLQKKEGLVEYQIELQEAKT